LVGAAIVAAAAVYLRLDRPPRIARLVAIAAIAFFVMTPINLILITPFADPAPSDPSAINGIPTDPNDRWGTDTTRVVEPVMDRLLRQGEQPGYSIEHGAARWLIIASCLAGVIAASFILAGTYFKRIAAMAAVGVAAGVGSGVAWALLSALEFLGQLQ
jgi:hypothetical protein